MTFNLPGDCDLRPSFAPNYVTVIVRLNDLPVDHSKPLNSGVITSTAFNLTYTSPGVPTATISVPGSLPNDFPMECATGPSVVSPFSTLYGPQAVVLLPLAITQAFPDPSLLHQPCGMPGDCGSSGALACRGGACDWTYPIGQACGSDAGCASPGALKCQGGSCAWTFTHPVSLADWISSGAGGMMQATTPHSYTVGCGTLAGYEGGVDLLWAQLTMARNMGCNVVNLQNFGTDLGGTIPEVPGVVPAKGGGIPDDILQCVMKYWRDYKGIKGRAWSQGALSFVTNNQYGGVRLVPRFDFDFRVNSNGVAPCWGPATHPLDGPGCSIASLFQGQRDSYRNSEHPFDPSELSPVYFLHGDEVLFLYPAGGPNVAGDGDHASLLPASQPNQPSELEDQLPAFKDYLQMNGVLLADLGLASWQDLGFPDAMTNLWFTCRTHAPANSSCTSPAYQIWLGQGNHDRLGPDPPQRKLLYWTMEFLQDSHANAAGEAHQQSRTVFPEGNLVLDAEYTQTQGGELFPLRLYNSAETEPETRVKLQFDWKRLGQVADVWAEYHQSDWQLNLFDLQAALQQSALLSNQNCVPHPGELCLQHKMGGDIVLKNAGDGLDANPQMTNDNRYRFLSLAGHGAQVLQLFNLGPYALNVDSWSDSPNNGQMSDAMSVLKNSEGILFGAQRDPAPAAIVLPPFSSRLWLDSSDYARYDHEIVGLFLALAHNGTNVDFIDDRDLAQNLVPLGGYQAIYVVAPNLSRAAQQNLLSWVEWNGGTLALTPGAATSNEFGDFTGPQDRAIYAAFFDRFLPGQEWVYDGGFDGVGLDAQRRDPFPVGPWVSASIQNQGTATISQSLLGDTLWSARAVVDQDGLWPFLPGQRPPGAFGTYSPPSAAGGLQLGISAPGGQGPRTAAPIMCAAPFYPPMCPMCAGGAVLFYEYYPGSSYLLSGAAESLTPDANPLTHPTQPPVPDPAAYLLPKGWSYPLATAAAIPIHAGLNPLPQVLVEEIDHTQAQSIITSPAQGIAALTWRCNNQGLGCTPGVAVVLLNFGGSLTAQNAALNRLRVTVSGLPMGVCPTATTAGGAEVSAPSCADGQAVVVFAHVVDADVLLLTFPNAP